MEMIPYIHELLQVVGYCDVSAAWQRILDPANKAQKALMALILADELSFSPRGCDDKPVRSNWHLEGRDVKWEKSKSLILSSVQSCFDFIVRK